MNFTFTDVTQSKLCRLLWLWIKIVLRSCLAFDSTVIYLYSRFIYTYKSIVGCFLYIGWKLGICVTSESLFLLLVVVTYVQRKGVIRFILYTTRVLAPYIWNYLLRVWVTRNNFFVGPLHLNTFCPGLMEPLWECWVCIIF